tara:strand:+ start:9519 stop:9935 length:417 start_codon:yes stop_codon:yes gene_type:complete
MAKKKFRGAEIVKEIDDALDKGLARFLINTQSKLSVSSPIVTGRLASSWMIGKGVPDRSVPPERDEPAPPTLEKYGGPITMESDWWISSNLPYSERAAYDPGYVGRRGGGAGDWFTRIENNLANDAQRSFDFFLRKVK